jgi:hypothetical protein
MLCGASAAGKHGNDNNAEQDPGDRKAGDDSTATRLSATLLRPNKGRCERRVKLAASLYICEHWRRGAVMVVTLTSDMYHRASGAGNSGMCFKADTETAFERR